MDIKLEKILVQAKILVDNCCEHRKCQYHFGSCDYVRGGKDTDCNGDIRECELTLEDLDKHK